MNKTDMVDDPELLDLVELEVRELLSAVRVSRGRHSDDPRGVALKALESGEPGCGRDEVDRRVDGGAGHVHSGAGAGRGQAVPDAGGGRVHDHAAAGRW